MILRNVMISTLRSVARTRPLALLALLITLLLTVGLLQLTGRISLARATTCDIVGIIASDRTIGPSAEGCDIYNLTGSLIVNEGVTLTIEPATTLKLGADMSLTVDGSLVAQGTASQQIRFTAATANNWGYIYFSPTSVPGSIDANGVYTGGSSIQYATIERAGSSSVSNNGALRAENSVPYIDHVTVHDNAARGIYIFNLSRTSYSYRIANSTIINNTGGGISISASGANNKGTLLNNQIIDNATSSGSGGGAYLSITGTGSVMCVDGNTINGNSASSSNGGGMYFSISTGSSVTPSTLNNNTISSNGGANGAGVYLAASSSLSVSSNTINGNTTTSSSGTGGGIYLSSSDSATLTNNNISNNTAGSAGGGIYSAGSGATITGNTISGNVSQNGAGAGMYFSSGSPALSTNTIISNRAERNPTGGIYIGTGSLPTINDNDIYGNSGSGANYDIYNANTSSATDIDATNNFWNTIDLTTIENQIFHGIDDSGLGQVVYSPYRSSPIGTRSTPVPPLTPTSMATRTPIPARTPTTVPGTTPQISRVLPDSGQDDADNTILISGATFASGVSAKLGDTALSISQATSRSLLAVVPAGLAPGRYDLSVTNPGGAQATLANAYTVFSASGPIDLSAEASDLWVSPAAPQAGVVAQIGLFVRRQGGSDALQTVAVEFRRDAPNGKLLGSANVPFIDGPGGLESTMPLNVTFPSAEQVTIYAIIDPANAVSEGDETNNIISNMITVATSSADQTMPVVQTISINNGASVTSDATISVTVSANDPAPNASGVTDIHLIEYVYNTGAHQWVPVTSSGWLDYSATPTNVRWTLAPIPGMHYLQVHTRDAAGNISVGSARQLINYDPPSDTVNRRETRVYRYAIAAGQQLTIDLEVRSDDADLYVWSSKVDQSKLVSNQDGRAHEQVITPVASEAMVYQIEVYGYSTAEYQLTISTAGTQATLEAGGISPSKEQSTAPALPVASLPDENQGSLSLPQDGNRDLYLPLIVR